MMTLTTLVYLGIGVLLADALWRRTEGLSLTLAFSFLFAVGAAQIAPGDHIKPVLMALDALTAVAAWFLWWRHQSSRAHLVAWLALCKILFCLATVDWPPIVWASGNNALFVVMILVAGGLTNGIIAWLGRRLAGPRARRSGVLRYLARFE
jgi:hypothetical protein